MNFFDGMRLFRNPPKKTSDDDAKDGSIMGEGDQQESRSDAAENKNESPRTSETSQLDEAADPASTRNASAIVPKSNKTTSGAGATFTAITEPAATSLRNLSHNVIGSTKTIWQKTVNLERSVLQDPLLGGLHQLSDKGHRFTQHEWEHLHHLEHRIAERAQARQQRRKERREKAQRGVLVSNISSQSAVEATGDAVPGEKATQSLLFTTKVVPVLPPDEVMDRLNMEVVLQKRLCGVTPLQFFERCWSDQEQSVYGPWCERDGKENVQVGAWEPVASSDVPDSWDGESYEQQRLVQYTYNRDPSTLGYKLGKPIVSVSQRQYVRHVVGSSSSPQQHQQRSVVSMTMTTDGEPFANNFVVHIRGVATTLQPELDQQQQLSDSQTTSQEKTTDGSSSNISNKSMPDMIVLDFGVAVEFVHTFFMQRQVQEIVLTETQRSLEDLFVYMKEACGARELNECQPSAPTPPEQQQQQQQQQSRSRGSSMLSSATSKSNGESLDLLSSKKEDSFCERFSCCWG